MEKNINKLYANLNKAKISIKEKLNNDKGEGVVTFLVFAGILLIAVIALQPTVKETFTSLGDSFKAFISTQTSKIFTTN